MIKVGIKIEVTHHKIMMKSELKTYEIGVVTKIDNDFFEMIFPNGQRVIYPIIPPKDHSYKEVS